MSKTRIKVAPTGSYQIQGDFELVDREGTPFGLGDRTRITLCGCGTTQNPPFCDGSHNQIELSGDRAARDLP
ncbi:MAG: CDGSH iron-sulfur domain-containing protein [Holophagales bacterium]|nr:CDGSH iron-sulfur domain-containing protein [Holophagales bacterium]